MDDNEQSVIEAIKQIHASGGKQLSKQEIVEFITRPIWLGSPRALDKWLGKRGRPITKTQYDDAYQRRKDLFRRLVKLPHIGKAVQHECTHDHVLIVEIAKEVRLCGIKRGVSKHVLLELVRRNRPIPSPATIRKILKRHGFN